MKQDIENESLIPIVFPSFPHNQASNYMNSQSGETNIPECMRMTVVIKDQFK